MIIYPKKSTAELLELVSELADMLQHARSEIDVDAVEHELQIVSEEIRLRKMAADENAAEAPRWSCEEEMMAALYDDQCAGR
jgi:predicted transcriptional regulator